MARTRTRQALRDDARALADQEDSDYISDSVANHWINEELAALQSLLIDADPARFMSSTSINATAGTFLYTLPADFEQILMVERVDGNNRATTLDPFVLNAKNDRDNFPFDATPEWGPSARYMVRGQGQDGTGVRLWLYPDPGTATYTVYYVTTPPQFDVGAGADAQAIEGGTGWLDWVVFGVAARMATAAEDHETAAMLLTMRREVEQRVRHQATQRDAGRPTIPTDVRRSHDFYPRAR